MFFEVHIPVRKTFSKDQWKYLLKPIVCEGVLRHRNTMELDSNNLRAVGPNHAQLRTEQNRKQDNKTRHEIKTR